MRKYRNIRVGVAATLAGGLLAAYAGAASAEPGPTPSTFKQVTFKAQDVAVDKLTTATNMTKDNDAPARAFTSPTSMLVKPDDPRVIVAATAEQRGRQCYLTVSKDAGRTWHFSKELPTDPAYPFCTTNQVAGVPLTMLAWGSNDTLYYAHEAYGDVGGERPEGIREGRTSIVLARTTNLGETWQTTLVDNQRGSTATPPAADDGVTGLAVDTSGSKDVVYVGFTQRFPDAAMDSPLRLPHVMVATSTDGGVTFEKPVDLNTFQRPTLDAAGKTYPIYMMASFGAPYLVAHDGVLLAVAGSTFGFNDQPAPPPEAGTGLNPGSWYAYPMPQLIARSTDQGKTWTINKLSEPVFMGQGAFTGLGWTPDGGDNGSFVAVYAATPQTAPSMNLEDIVMQRSTDGGITWSTMLAIDDDTPEMNASGFYPQLNVAPDGRVDVAWQDVRERTTTDFYFDVRYTYSTDGGQTWAPNVKVNDLPLNFNYGISFNSDLRYPNGVASTDEYALIGWADTRNANELSQAQDSYAAGVQFAPLPTTKNTAAPIIAAIFGGLAVAGVVLLIVLLMRRGSAGTTTAPTKAGAKVTT
ncbi:MAG: sialidase family protein [Acidimicrobiales bacterium]